MSIQLSPIDARQKWDDVVGIAAVFVEDNTPLMRAEMSFTDLDDISSPFWIQMFLDPQKALESFMDEGRRLFEIDLDNLDAEDPYKVAMNFYRMFVS